MTNHNDNTLISQAQDLVKQEGNLQWAWGDWALDAEPILEDFVNTGSRSRIAELLDKVEGAPAFDTVLACRRTANRFPPKLRRSGWSFTTHRILASWSDEKIADLPDKLTQREAQSLVSIERNRQEDLLRPTGTDQGDLDSLPEQPTSQRKPLAAPPSYGRRVWGVTQAFLDAAEHFEALDKRLEEEGIEFAALTAEGFDSEEVYDKLSNVIRICEDLQRTFKQAEKMAKSQAKK